MIENGYTEVPITNRQAGDIMIMYDSKVPPQAHIGIVLDNGNVLSNSSTNASFNREETPEEYNNYYGGTGRIYRKPSSTYTVEV